MSYDSPFSAAEAEAQIVPQRTTIPMTLGIMNIAFGVLLMLLALFGLMSAVITPMMSSMFADMNKQMQAQGERRFDERRKRLQEEAAAADDEKQRELIESQLKELAKSPVPAMPDISKMVPTDRRLTIWGVSDAISGLLVNLLLVIAGVGLVMRREWGRKWGVGVSVVKVIRVVTSYCFWIFMCVPIISKQIGGAMNEFMTQAAKGKQPPFSFEVLYGAIYTGYGVLMIVAGMIYPIVCLWLLTRPRVKAALAAPAARNIA